jgi:O-antigen ligase
MLRNPEMEGGSDVIPSMSRKAKGRLMGRIDRSELLDWIQSVILALAVIALFQQTDLQISSGLVLIWLVLSLLRQAHAHPWTFVLLGLLMLNLRWVVLDEGPTPVSPVDYILMLTAFGCGFGRAPAWWLRQASIIAVATLIGVGLQLDVVADFAYYGIEYHIAALTKNQTALLAGLASLCSLIGLLAARLAWSRLLHTLCLAAGLILLRAADSRAGLGMVGIAVLGAALMAFGPRLVALARRRFGPLRRQLLIGGFVVVAVLLMAWLLMQLRPDLSPASGGAGGGWSYGEENLENDIARLRLWNCYLGLPFTGSNRFIWGVGYEKAWRVLCTAQQVGRPLSHAHNLLLQVWAENGFVGAVFFLVWLGWIFRRIAKNIRQASAGRGRIVLFASSAVVIYLLGFNLVELGMVKIPLFLLFFGLFLAFPFSVPWSQPAQPCGCLKPAVSA